jgi:hypothetical protein
MSNLLLILLPYFERRGFIGGDYLVVGGDGVAGMGHVIDLD